MQRLRHMLREMSVSDPQQLFCHLSKSKQIWALQHDQLAVHPQQILYGYGQAFLPEIDLN